MNISVHMRQFAFLSKFAYSQIKIYGSKLVYVYGALDVLRSIFCRTFCQEFLSAVCTNICKYETIYPAQASTSPIGERGAMDIVFKPG